MNKLKLFIILPGFIVPSFAIAQGTSYLINGKVGKLSSPAKAYLFVGEKVDSAVFHNGLFKFSGFVDQPKGAFLLINKKGTGTSSGQMGYNTYALRFYLEPGKTSITSPDSINNANVSAGVLNADYVKLKERLRSADSALARLKDYILTAGKELSGSKEFSDSCEKQFAVVAKLQKEVYLQFIKNNPGSLMSLFVLKCYGGYDYSMLLYNAAAPPSINELDSLYHSLSINIRSGKAGKEFGDMIARLKKTGIGFMAINFTQPDTSGKLISLHDFKGKYVLIDFWASWCGPCRAENPAVVKVFNKFKDKGFTVLGISLDYSNAKQSWLKAIKDDHLNWTQVSDLKGWNNKVAQLYGITSIPQNYLIDPTGKIVGKNLRGDALEKTLNELNLH